jgi:putative DNA primase/helicase
VTDQLTPVEKILGRLEDYKERKGEFRARCPAHNGNSNNSLSIKEGDHGRALLICRAGCDVKDIVNALGLEMAHLFAHNRPSPSRGTAKKATRKTGAEDKILATDELPAGTYWEFTSPAGEVLYIQRHKREYYRKVGEDRW